MTKEEYEIFKEGLQERFYWTYNKRLVNFLTKEKHNRYLFRCTHYKTHIYFWVFDKTESLLNDVEDFGNLQKG